jgi:hypothetical protein
MRDTTYKIRIPIPDKEGEFEETTFSHREDVCEFLNISQATFYTMIKNKERHQRYNNSHLKGITIEVIRPQIEKKREVKVKRDPENDRKEYVNNLLHKIKK